MPVSSVGFTKSQATIHSDVNVTRKSFFQIHAIARKVGLFALGALAIYALANIPSADAGARAYLQCINICKEGMNWIKAIVCPTICAPFLLAPGG